MSRQLFPSSKTQLVALIFLILFYVSAALAHAYFAPLTTGPDELAHYEYVRFIAEHGRLPLTNNERGQASYKSDQPPLYHVIAALPASLVDPTGPPFLKRVSDHPRRQLIERTRHAWGLYNTEDEQWPYRAEVLRWHIGRWVAIFFGAATVIVTFFIARALFSITPLVPQRRSEARERVPHDDAENGSRGEAILALGAAAVVAFIPRLVLTGSMLNYETTQAFFAALFLWVLMRMAIDDPAADKPQTSKSSVRRSTAYVPRRRNQDPRFILYALLLGLFAGLAVTAKLSALILLVEIVIALWLIRRYLDWPWQAWLRAVVIAALGTLVAAGWWFGFILYQFNTVAQDGWWIGLLRPLIAADASDATTNRLLSALSGGQAGFTGAIENLDSGPPWQWLAIFFRTFWVVGIEGFGPLGLFGLAVAVGFCLVAAWGLVSAWRADQRGRATNNGRGLGSGSGISTGSVAAVRLILSLLGLHLLMAFILPLLRYAATFSLADTAQGRHVLFLAAPAFAILLVWGWSTAFANWFLKMGHDVLRGPMPNALRTTPYASRLKSYVVRIFPLIPALFLLAWSGVQLWYMTWAYLPPLPVRTVPDPTVSQPRDQTINDYVRLVGFDTVLKADRSWLRLDLLWQATAISPVDFLTEVSLLDQAGQVRAQWVGYPAQGRYPTRAWDVGDRVRDTAWLRLADLKPGPYQLTLSLVPTVLNLSPAGGPQQPNSPLTLTTITLPGSLSAQRAASNDLSHFSDPQVSNSPLQLWQNGQLLTVPQTIRYRETILITFNPVEAGQPYPVQIRGPLPPTGGELTAGKQQHYSPDRQVGHTALFIVGPEWSSGQYQVELIDGNDPERQIAAGPAFQIVDRWQRHFKAPDISHRLEANFANQVMLLGYDLSTNRAEPGGAVPVTLYWQGIDWMGTDYTIFAKLLAADQTVYGGRDRLPREGYRTIYWAPGEVVSDPFGVPVAADAPQGVYTLNVGLYRQVGEQALSLPLVQDGQLAEASSVNIGPIKIGGAPPNLTLNQARPQVMLNQPFGVPTKLTLLGYDLTDENSQPVTTNQLSTAGHQLRPTNLRLTLYWRSEDLLALDYTTFVHLRDAQGETIAQKDQQPLQAAYPTSLWDPGEIIADEVIISLPVKMEHGSHQLVVGMYDFQTGERLPIPGQPDSELKLAALDVP